MNIEQYAKRKQFYSDEVPPLLSECLVNSEWESLADLGCGDGSLIYALTQRGYFQNKSVFAVDLSKSRIDRVKEQNSGVTCLVADACNTGLGDSSIDLLLSTQVIEHVEDDGEMAKEMFRILRPGGILEHCLQETIRLVFLQMQWQMDLRPHSPQRIHSRTTATGPFGS